MVFQERMYVFDSYFNQYISDSRIHLGTFTPSNLWVIFSLANLIKVKGFRWRSSRYAPCRRRSDLLHHRPVRQEGFGLRTFWLRSFSHSSRRVCIRLHIREKTRHVFTWTSSKSNQKHRRTARPSSPVRTAIRYAPYGRTSLTVSLCRTQRRRSPSTPLIVKWHQSPPISRKAVTATSWSSPIIAPFLLPPSLFLLPNIKKSNNVSMVLEAEPSSTFINIW